MGVHLAELHCVDAGLCNFIFVQQGRLSLPSNVRLLDQITSLLTFMSNAGSLARLKRAVKWIYIVVRRLRPPKQIQSRIQLANLYNNQDQI